MKGFYDIQISDIFGQSLDLHQWMGKKILIVNVASACGYTIQYTQLEELNRTFKDSLAILACPCNDFGGQEPGTAEQIYEFCQSIYGVSFQLTEKLHIKYDRHQLYQYLMEKDRNGLSDFDVEWNFHKFLLNEDGSIHKSLSPATDPLSDEILDWVQGK